MNELSSAGNSIVRIAYFTTHPIQYQAPLLRYLAADPRLALSVFFYSDFSVREHLDPGYGVRIRWDVPLLEGYQFSFVKRFLRTGRCNRKLWNPAVGLKSLLRRGGFHAVWIHGWSHICSLQALYAARKLGIPVLVRGESLPDRLCIGNRRTFAARTFQNAVLRQVSSCLCIGSANREFYLQRRLPPERLSAMPYAVDNGFFQRQVTAARSNREALRARLGLDSRRPVVLFAGRLSEVKGPDVLLEAMLTLAGGYGSMAVSLDSPVRTAPNSLPYLLFAGDGPMRPALEERARSLPSGSVHFLGFKKQTELPAIYDLCDVFVLPSRFEPWGLVVNEVMNAAKAVILSDRVGAGFDLVTPALNGWIYPHQDSRTLTNCLREALMSPQRLQEMGRRSLERINSWNFETDRRGFWSALHQVGAG